MPPTTIYIFDAVMVNPGFYFCMATQLHQYSHSQEILLPFYVKMLEVNDKRYQMCLF